MEYSVELRETVICGGVDEEGGDEMDLMNEDPFQLDFEKYEIILVYGGDLFEDGENITPTLCHGIVSEPDPTGEQRFIKCRGTPF